MTDKLPYFLLAFVMGLSLAAQPVLNAEMARHTGHALSAASVSLLVSFVVVVPVGLLVFPRDTGFLANVPWWAWFGGVTGAVSVLGGLMVVPVLGVVAAVACVLLGQVVGSALIDHSGAFHSAVRPIGVERALAIVLVLAGIGLFVRASS